MHINNKYLHNIVNKSTIKAKNKIKRLNVQAAIIDNERQILIRRSHQLMYSRSYENTINARYNQLQIGCLFLTDGSARDLFKWK